MAADKASKKLKRKPAQKKQTSENNRITVPMSGWLYLLGVHRYFFRQITKNFKTMRLVWILQCILVATAFMIPLFFYLALKILSPIAGNINSNPILSVYLQPNISKAQVDEMINQITNSTNYIVKTVVIAPEAGIKKLETQLGVSDMTKVLGENPLPTVIQVVFKTNTAMSDLQSKVLLWKQNALVQDVSFNKNWLLQLRSLLKVLIYVIVVLTVILSTTVFLSIHSTISSMIYKLQEEIKISLLCGATKIFIGLPFIYIGMLFGCIGMLLAVFLMDVLYLWMIPVLVKIFQFSMVSSNYYGLIFSSTFDLLLLGLLLGFGGGLFSCITQIKKISL